MKLPTIPTLSTRHSRNGYYCYLPINLCILSPPLHSNIYVRLFLGRPVQRDLHLCIRRSNPPLSTQTYFTSTSILFRLILQLTQTLPACLRQQSSEILFLSAELLLRKQLRQDAWNTPHESYQGWDQRPNPHCSSLRPVQEVSRQPIHPALAASAPFVIIV